MNKKMNHKIFDFTCCKNETVFFERGLSGNTCLLLVTLT